MSVPLLLALALSPATLAPAPIAPVAATPSQAETRTLVHQVHVAAPPEAVWQAFTTAEGLVAWMGVAKAEVDLRAGGTWRTTYDPQGTLGDDSTIEHAIVDVVAPRLFAWHTVRGPKGFDIERFGRIAWVLTFEAAPSGGTQVTLTGSGWESGPGWDELYGFFDRGNAETLQRLVDHFATGSAGAAAAGATGAPAASDDRAESYRAHIGAAEACLRLDEAAAAAQWLDGAPVEERGWEWGWLAARSDESLRTLKAHEDVAFGLSLSADGKRLASAGYDRAARLWNAATGELELTLSGHTEGLWAAVFTPDGSQVITASADRTARLWDAATGVSLSTLWTHEHPVSCVDVSPDGATFAASSYAPRPDARGIVGIVKLFDAGTHDELATLQAGDKPLSLIRFSPDGKRLAAASWDSNVHVWDVASGELKASLSLQIDDDYSAADALAWSPDGTRLAASGKNGVIMVFDTVSGKPVGQLRGHAGAVGGLAYHPSGTLLASGGEDGTVRLWSAASGTPLAVLHGERGFVHGMTFSLDGTVLHTVSSTGTLRSWAGDPKVYRASSAMGHEASYAIAIDPSGTKLVSGNHDSRLRLFSLRDGETLYEFEVSDSPVIDVAYAPDGKSLAVCLQNGAARIVDAGSGGLRFDLGDELQTTTGLAWSHDGHFVALLDGDDTVAVFDARTGSQIVRSGPGPEVRNGAMGRPGFSPDDHLIVAPFAEEARLIDPITGAELRRLPGPGGRMSTTQFLPDGRRAAGLTHSGKLVVWNTETGATLWSADGHDSSAYRLAISPDGRRIASGANELIVWDSGSGARLLDTRVHSTGLYDLTFSPDGTRLAWCAASGRLGVLDALPLRDRLSHTP